MKVLMIGAGRKVQGGISTVVNQYYEAGLGEKVELSYIPTMEDGGRLKKFFVMICAMIRVCLCLKKYDILHVHMASRASFYRKSCFIKVAKRYRKKIIIHMHGAEFDIFYDKECTERQKEMVRRIFSMADAVIALSEEWKEYLGKICEKDKICVIYNAVKIPGYIRTNYNNHNVLFLGRLGQRKGVYDLIEVMPEIIKAVPDVHFYFGGDGEIERCKEQCFQKGIYEYVTFLGWITGEKKEKFLEKCSVFALPSYHEGMPMSLLEAMSYGNIVVSTMAGGIPKVIRDGFNGYLVNQGDLQALKEKLIIALLGEEKEKIGANAFGTIQRNFYIKNSIYQLEILYMSLFEG